MLLIDSSYMKFYSFDWGYHNHQTCSTCLACFFTLLYRFLREVQKNRRARERMRKAMRCERAK